MENHSASTIIGSAKAPYINALVRGYGLAASYFNIAHPSLPNYLGAVSGQPLSSLPLTDCTNCKQAGSSIFTQGESWKSYQESMTVPCEPYKSPDGLYVPRHNPALYYTQIPAVTCKADDVPYPVLATDLAQNTLPAFSFITPNLVDDMHNGAVTASVGVGDTWLANHLPAILASPGYQAGTTVVFLTWDEGSGLGNVKGTDCINSPTNPSCRVALAVISPYGTPGTVASSTFTHYSLLRATEELLGLPLLGQAAVAPDIAPAFGL
jgi:phospholipase C